MENAQTIGLLPDLPRERFEFIGNGSWAGQDVPIIESAGERAFDLRVITYVDLSSSSKFFDQYSSALFLPHTDLDQFPSVRERLER